MENISENIDTILAIILKRDLLPTLQVIKLIKHCLLDDSYYNSDSDDFKRNETHNILSNNDVGDSSESLASRGLNIAKNVISEFLRLAPLASSWKRDKRPTATNDFRKDTDSTQIDLGTISPIPLNALETESAKLNSVSLFSEGITPKIDESREDIDGVSPISFNINNSSNEMFHLESGLDPPINANKGNEETRYVNINGKPPSLLSLIKRKLATQEYALAIICLMGDVETRSHVMDLLDLLQIYFHTNNGYNEIITMLRKTELKSELLKHMNSTTHSTFSQTNSAHPTTTFSTTSAANISSTAATSSSALAVDDKIIPDTIYYATLLTTCKALLVDGKYTSGSIIKNTEMLDSIKQLLEPSPTLLLPFSSSPRISTYPHLIELGISLVTNLLCLNVMNFVIFEKYGCIHVILESLQFFLFLKESYFEAPIIASPPLLNHSPDVVEEVAASPLPYGISIKSSGPPEHSSQINHHSLPSTPVQPPSYLRVLSKSSESISLAVEDISVSNQYSLLSEAGYPPINPRNGWSRSTATDMILKLLPLIRHIAILSSERDTSLLAWFVFAATTKITSSSNTNSNSNSNSNQKNNDYRFKSPSLFSLRQQQSSSSSSSSFEKLNQTTAINLDKEFICHNCEMEIGRFECLDEGCIYEDCSCLCQECDRVFHRAVAKRFHIRLPIVLEDHLSPILAMIPNDYRNILLQSQAKEGEEEKKMESTFVGVTNTTNLPCKSNNDLGEEEGTDDIWAEGVIMLLVGIRSLLDDRHVRQQAIPVMMLSPILSLLRILVGLLPFKLLPNYNCTSSSSSSDLSTRHISTVIPPSLCLTLRHQEIICNLVEFTRLSSSSSIDQSEPSLDATLQEPPEDIQNNAQRICLALITQIIARFFAIDSEFISSSTGGKPRGTLIESVRVTDTANSNQKDIVTGRIAIIELVQTFMKHGCDALFVFLCSQKSISIPLTLSDKQFILWTLREVAVSATWAHLASCSQICEWFVWILKCPLIKPEIKENMTFPALFTPTSGQSTSSATSVYGIVHSKPLVTLKKGWKPSPIVTSLSTSQSGCRSKGKGGRDVSFLNSSSQYHVAPVPTATYAIYNSIRQMAIQEIRLLMGGDDWLPVLHGESAAVYWKTLTLPWIHPSSSTGSSSTGSGSNRHSFTNTATTKNASSRDNRDNNSVDTTSQSTNRRSHSKRVMSPSNGAKLKEGSSRSLASLNIPFRIPQSNAIIKKYFLRSGLVEALLELTFGSQCNSDILELLTSSISDTTTANRLQQNLSFSDYFLEDWWCALTTLTFLVSNSEEAKDLVDGNIGVQCIVRTLLPLAQMNKIPSCLSHFLVELCICNGRITPPSRPFFFCGRLPLIQNNSNNISTGKQSLNRTRSSSHSGLNVNQSNDTTNNNVNPLQSLAMRNCEHLLSDCDQNDTLLASLSPMYDVHYKAVQYMIACMRPNTTTALQPKKSLRESNSDMQPTPASAPNDEWVRQSSLPTLDSAEQLRSLYVDSQTTSAPTCAESDVAAEDFSEHGRKPSSNHSISYGLSLSHSQHDAGITLHQRSATSVTLRSASSLARHKMIDFYGNQLISEHDDCNISIAGAPEYSLYVPFLSALGWGMRGDSTKMLHHICFNINSRAKGNNESSLTAGKQTPINDNLSPSLQSGSQFRGRSVLGGNERLQLGLSKSGVNTHIHMLFPPKGFWETKSSWQPPFSRLKIRSEECAEVLIATALITHAAPQRIITSSLSYFLEGNPANAAIMNRSQLGTALAKIVPALEEKLRNPFSHLLSQLLRHDITDQSLKVLLHVARRTSNGREDAIDAIRDLSIPACGIDSKKVILNRIPIKCGEGNNGESSTVQYSDFVGRLMLYALGRAAERQSPPSFVHFDQMDPLRDVILLPPIEKLPLAKVGFSLNTWVRLGSMGEIPIAPFLQMYNEEKGRDFGNTAPPSLHIIDIFFRLQYHLPSTVQDTDIASVTSGVTTMPGDFCPLEESSKKVIQLCISFRNHGRQGSDKGESTMKYEDMDSKEDCRLNGESKDREYDLISHFAVPDIIIDFEWSELGDWHLLSLCFTGEELNCWVDGISKRVLYWSPLGYREDCNGCTLLSDTNNLIPYPVASKEFPLIISLGGFSCEQEKLRESSDSLKRMLEEQSFFGARTKSNSLGCDNVIRNKIFSVQSFHMLTRGFCGYIGELSMSEGTVETSQLLTCAMKGAFCGLKSLTGKRITGMNPCDISAGDDNATYSTAKIINSDMSVVSTTRGRSGMPTVDESFDESKQFGRKRMSRSLSPNTMNRMGTTDTTTRARALSPSPTQGHTTDKTTTTLQTSSRLRNSGEFRNAGNTQSSLVSDLFTMLTGSNRDTPDQMTVHIGGELQVYHTNALSDEKVLGKIGGLKVWFPLLVMDRSHQVATLRVLGGIFASSLTAYKDFLESQADNVILYCLHRTPSITSSESLQVFFDDFITTLPKESNTLSTTGSKHSTDVIQRIPMLKLLMYIIVASPRKPQLARSAVDWLRSICDEIPENILKVLESVGLAPFLIILSQWTVAGSGSLTSMIGPSSVDIDIPLRRCTSAETSESKLVDPSASTRNSESVKRKQPQIAGVGGISVSALPGESFGITSADMTRAQVSVSRLLKILLMGTSAEFVVPSALPCTPTSTSFGFQTSHMTYLVNFLQYSLRRVEIESKRSIVALKTSNTIEISEESSSSPKTPSMKETSTSTATSTRLKYLLEAIKIVIDSIVEAAESALGATILNLLKLSLPGNTLWYFVLDLSGCCYLPVRLKALTLLGLLLSSFDGTLDPKQVASFEKMSGFQCLADQLGNKTDDKRCAVADALLNMMFWRRQRKGVSVFLPTGQPMSGPGGFRGSSSTLNVIEETETVTTSGMFLYQDEDEEEEEEEEEEVGEEGGEMDAPTSGAVIHHDVATIDKECYSHSLEVLDTVGPMKSSNQSKFINESNNKNESATIAVLDDNIHTTSGIRTNSTHSDCCTESTISLNSKLREEPSLCEQESEYTTLSQNIKSLPAPNKDGSSRILTSLFQWRSRSASAPTANNNGSSTKLISTISEGNDSNTTIDEQPLDASKSPTRHPEEDINGSYPVIEQVESTIISYVKYDTNVTKGEEVNNSNGIFPINKDISANDTASSNVPQSESLHSSSLSNHLLNAPPPPSSPITVIDDNLTVERSYSPTRSRSPFRAFRSPQTDKISRRTTSTLKSPFPNVGGSTFTNNSYSGSSIISDIELIHLPQIFQALTKVLQSCVSSEKITLIMRAVNDCISLAPDRHHASATKEREILVETYAIVARNVALLTDQRDWIFWISDTLFNLYGQCGYDTDVISVNPVDTHATTVLSSAGPFSNNNINNPNIMPKYSHQGWMLQGRVFRAFCQPFLSFLMKVIQLDIRFKPSSNRKMYDILRLPIPQFRDIQLMIVSEVLDVFQSFDLNTDDVINILRNISGFVDQLLENISLPIEIIVRVIQTLNYLSYHIPVAVRSRIKETLLPEVRSSYVTKCLLDRADDLILRVDALSDIHTSVENLVVLNECKVLSSTQILLLLLSLFVEITDELDCLSQSSHMEMIGCPPLTENEVTRPRTNSDAVTDRMQMLLDSHITVVMIIQNCVTTSPECRKYILRLLQDVDSGDATRSAILISGFVNTHSSSQVIASYVDVTGSSTVPLTTTTAVSTSTSDQKHGVAIREKSGSKGGTSNGVSSSWWGSWGSNTTGTGNNVTLPSSPVPNSDITNKAVDQNIQIRSSTKNGSDSQSQSQIVVHDVETGLGDWMMTATSESVTHEGIRMSTDNSVNVGGAAAAVASGNVQKPPIGSIGFIEWFDAVEQRDIQLELKKRVSKEFLPVSRLVEKYLDKSVSKVLRFTRQQQERYSKSKNVSLRSQRDQLEQARMNTDKRSLHFEYEVGRWVAALFGKLEKGALDFHRYIEEEKSSSVSPTSPLANVDDNKNNIQTLKINDITLPSAVLNILSPSSSSSSSASCKDTHPPLSTISTNNVSNNSNHRHSRKTDGTSRNNSSQSIKQIEPNSSNDYSFEEFQSIRQKMDILLTYLHTDSN